MLCISHRSLASSNRPCLFDTTHIRAPLRLITALPRLKFSAHSHQMILPHIAQLNQKRIILASGSPRRKELLKVLGLQKFEVCVAVRYALVSCGWLVLAATK